MTTPTTRTTYAESKTTGSSGACLTKAPCGGKCCCNGHIPHQLHCCKAADCAECHEVQVPRVRKAVGA